MKKSKPVLTYTALVLVFVIVCVGIWWRVETGRGHHLAIAPFQSWGFYSMGGETLAAYPPGEQDDNRVYETHQYGPINDSWEYLACEKERPFCTPH